MPNGSRLHLLARGAAKSRKRFSGGVLDPGHLVEAVFRSPRQEQGLATLEDARLIESYDGVRADYDRLQFTMRILQVINQTSPGGEQAGLFPLLAGILSDLGAGRAIAEVEVSFAQQFLKLHGVLRSEEWLDDEQTRTVGGRELLLSRLQDYVRHAQL